jgi:hypothetical protein
MFPTMFYRAASFEFLSNHLFLSLDPAARHRQQNDIARMIIKGIEEFQFKF